MKHLFLFLFLALAVSVSVSAQTADTCTATTQAGKRCSRVATREDGKCRIHSTLSAKCVGTTKNGAPCKSIPATGHKYCWRHDPERPKTGHK